VPGEVRDAPACERSGATPGEVRDAPACERPAATPGRRAEA